MDFDSQLIESVEVRRGRLSASFLFGRNPTERRWKDRTPSFVYGLIVAALICAFCVAISFVVNIVSNYLADREEREQQQEQRDDQREQLQGVRDRPAPAAAGVSPAGIAALDRLPATPSLPTTPWRS
jgi:flagellar biosynthesis/type III secretory pathway M-ring protein FliF/YscJ